MDRLLFWRRLDEVIARGSNRIDWATIAPLIAARIPRLDQARGREVELDWLRERQDGLPKAMAAACQLKSREMAMQVSESAAWVAKRIEELEAEMAVRRRSP